MGDQQTTRLAGTDDAGPPTFGEREPCGFFNLDEAVEFLRHLRPNGPWVLTAIVPDGLATTETFADEKSLQEFVREHNVDQRQNVYYTINAVRGRVIKKPSKSDIAFAEFLHVDADPNENETPEQFKDRFIPILREFVPQASGIVDSGNGIQALWRLTGPIDDVIAIENANKALMQALGAPKGTQNIDRIFRLPGTVNWPTAKKKKIGRIECLSSLVEFNDVSNPLSSFPSVEEKSKAGPERAENTGGTALPPNIASLLHIENSGPYPSRSELAFAFITMALKAKVADETIVAACLDEAYKGCGIFEHCSDNGGRSYVERQVVQAREKTPAASPESIAAVRGNFPVIRVVKGEIARVVDEAESALIAAETPVFTRAGKMVHPITETLPAADNQITKSVLLRPMEIGNVIYLLNKYATTFERYDERRKAWVKTDPPNAVAAILLQKGQWSFPRIIGVTTVPTMRPDGSILDRPGYDRATQLWYELDDGLIIPTIKERPTRDDAVSSLELLKGLLNEFPLVSDIDLAVALAAMMTPVLRGAIDVAPMFLFCSPVAGTGKSLMVNLTATIITGRSCPVITNCKSEEEMEKRIGALVMAGVPLISLDNCSIDLGGDLLCQITEQQLIRPRILGKSELPLCEWRGTAFATGNNISFLGDMTRRGLTANLDAGVERPELRTFTSNPIEKVLANRGSYIAAPLTIARAWLVSGEPDPPQIASYSKWSRIVRAPLMWLGLPDPVKAMDAARDEDPVRDAARRLIAIWARDLLAGTYTTAELIMAAKEFGPGQDYRRPELLDLLMQQAGHQGQIDNRRVGQWLRNIRGQVHDGYRIEVVRESVSHGHKYALVRKSPE